MNLELNRPHSINIETMTILCEKVLQYEQDSEINSAGTATNGIPKEIPGLCKKLGHCHLWQ